MSTLTIELLNPKARTILDGLEDAGLIALGESPKQRKMCGIMELKGLSAELWKDESADQYLRKERELCGRYDFDAPMEEFAKPVGKTPKPDCMKGRIWMADDFDAPLEEFEEYM